MSVFSSDLVTNARKHIWFLEQVHACGVSSYQGLTLESLRRYQHLWLPLVAQYQQQLIPPPDIAWLWHCHRLAPSYYKQYCQSTFHCLVEGNPAFTLDLSNDDNGDLTLTSNSIVHDTHTLWNKHYPNESFFLSQYGSDKESTNSMNIVTPLLCGFDLLASTQRQATFLWQVSGDNFKEDEFLEEGVANYINFLRLRPKAAKLGVILVPTYQIDLMWHTHILSSISDYDKDCMKIVNSTMNHDDSLTDRSEGGVLDRSFTATKSLWKQEYGFEYVVPGGMYRGEPPNTYFSSQWNSQKHWHAGSNEHLVGIVGASSTSTGPTKWVTLYECASDGHAAFIKTNAQTKKTVKKEKYLENYVLGRVKDVTGYYHIETKEAHQILLKRVRENIASLEQNIAMEKCCCGNPASIATLESNLAVFMEAQNVLQERYHANKPAGKLRTDRLSDARVYSSTGDWLYPEILYVCAGGSCGGDTAIACDGGAGCGGGCGGGGCGGGGCDGGGCGGGGCGGGGCG